MLMTGFGSHSKGLEGTVFTTLMSEIDQQRFLDLVAVRAIPDSDLENDDAKNSETSQSTQSSRAFSSRRLKWSSAPAKSIQVHIRDAAGVEEPGGHEISTSFQQLGSFSEVPPPGRAAAAGTSQQQLQVPPTRVLSDLRPNEATNGRDSKTSSGSGSSRGGSSTARLGQDDLPWIQRIEFQFDGMADSFPLLKASIFFDGHAATESSACRTMMKGWLMDSMLPRFRGWVQHTINNGMAGRGVTFNPTPSTVELLWPGREDMVLRADEVQFRVEVLDETEGLQVEQKTSQASRCTETTAHAEDADQEGEPDESVSVWVTMRGFHQCQSHEKKRSSRTAQSPGQARALAAIQ
ncbi:unnamed protein product, partial [Polarella glacialis]